MRWNDAKITSWAINGGVTPFDAACVNPASLDLRLGNTIRATRQCWEYKLNRAINRNTPPSELWDDPLEFNVYWLLPGQAVLCHSLEYITMPDDASGSLFSKSSTGRILLEHLHAGYFDPSFHGQATFEFINNGPWTIEIRPGERLVQLVLEQMIAAPQKSYLETGHYNGQLGATPAVAL